MKGRKKVPWSIMKGRELEYGRNIRVKILELDAAMRPSQIPSKSREIRGDFRLAT